MRANYAVFVDHKRRQADDCFIVALASLLRISYKEALDVGKRCGWNSGRIKGIQIGPRIANIRAALPAFKIEVLEWHGPAKSPTTGNFRAPGRGIAIVRGHCVAFGPQTVYQGSAHRPSKRLLFLLRFTLKTTTPRGAETFGHTPETFNVYGRS